MNNSISMQNRFNEGYLQGQKCRIKWFGHFKNIDDANMLEMLMGQDIQRVFFKRQEIRSIMISRVEDKKTQ